MELHVVPVKRKVVHARPCWGLKLVWGRVTWSLGLTGLSMNDIEHFLRLRELHTDHPTILFDRARAIFEFAFRAHAV